MNYLIAIPLKILCYGFSTAIWQHFSSRLVLHVTLLSVIMTGTLLANTDLESESKLPVQMLPVVDLKQAPVIKQILQRHRNNRVILVGETHNRFDHHLVQLEILKIMHQQSPDVALGVEWFQRPTQTQLDDYIAGKISEKEFIIQSDYFSRWGYDYRLYQPILRYARKHRIPVIALNATRELTSALSSTGFEDLEDDLKKQLPSHYDWSDKAYEQRLRKLFDDHPNEGQEFDGFLRSQLTWDESMAENAANYLKQHPGQRMLLLAGSGHIVYGSGIPNRIQRRIDVEPVSILVMESHFEVNKDIADYLVLSSAILLEPVGLIGAMLNTSGDRLIIQEFVENSAAMDAGVKKGAKIVAVNGIPVSSYYEFKIAVLDKIAGDLIQLQYLEPGDRHDSKPRSVEIRLR